MSLHRFSCLLASLAFALAPARAQEESESPDAPLSPGAEAFNPASPSTGSLPLPGPAPGSGSPDPPSGIVYVLPFIGLWLILRRRHRRVGT
jgi:hypothetical protein